MNNVNKSLKYPLYLFLSILALKLGYIVVESYYNYHVLSITTQPQLTKETIETLNINGHRISAIGITLLIIPFLYFIASRIFKENILSFLVIFSLFTYFIAYEGLNKLVDKIVEVNKEKRHDAYYINIFKYGVLNNIFVYDSFVDSKKIQNDTLDVNDRILLTNTFLLLHSDAELIEKLKDRGSNKIANLYIEKYAQEDFALKSEQFKEASQNIVKLWNEINQHKIILKKELDQLSEEKMHEAYELFVESLKQAYFDYRKGWDLVHQKIAYETTDEKIDKIQEKLDIYFKFERFKTIQKKYVKNVKRNFGHFIHPDEWKDENGDLTRESIKNLVRKEILAKVDDKLKKYPDGMRIKDFLYHYESRYVIMQKLQEYDILVPYTFDYSAKEFYKYFSIMSDKKHKIAYDLFYKKLEENIGHNDIKLSMDYKEFIYSTYIKRQIQEKLEIRDEKNTQNLLKALESKDLANFKDMVYFPFIREQVDEMTYDKEQFKDAGVASQYGDDAIKLLYIPPIALSISIVALLLNIFTVIGMFLVLMRFPRELRIVLKTSLVLIVLAVPMFFKAETINTHLLQQSTPKAQVYINFLAWISYYQKNNTLIHEESILPQLDELKRNYYDARDTVSEHVRLYLKQRNLI